MNINLLKFNRHWEKGFQYPYPKKRKIFSLLVSFLDKKQIVEITGLRRVGKTVLIFQLINYLIKKGLDPYHLLYFSFDESLLTIEELLNNYSTQTSIDYKKEKVFIFLDEIQKLKNFQNQLKIYYDLYPNIKFFISGSSSLFIRKKTQESLAGRTLHLNITPLTFEEYLMFVEKEALLQKPLLYQPNLEKEFHLYLRSQLIETIGIKSEEDRKYYLTSIVKKIIFEDLSILFNCDNPQILYQIVLFIGQNPGAEINNLHLAEELKISNKTIALYFSYLESSLLVKKLYNFSRNLVTSERKLKKYYLASPSFSLTLADFVDEGKIFENYLVSLNNWQYFYRDPFKHEVDFVVVEDNKKIIPIEAKYKKEIKEKELKNLMIFMDKYKVDEGKIFYLSASKKKIKIKGKTIWLLPYFCQ